MTKKRKPYSMGRLLHGPPKGWEGATRTGWLATNTGFISLWGKVWWHSRRAAWYGDVREMSRGPWVAYGPYHGFARPREAMQWVEEQYERRERKKKWYSVLE